MKNNPHNIKVGQTVYYRGRARGEEALTIYPCTVSKCGRVYFYVNMVDKPHDVAQFVLSTLDHYPQVGGKPFDITGELFPTLESISEHDKTKYLYRMIQPSFANYCFDRAKGYTPNQLEQICKILNICTE